MNIKLSSYLEMHLLIKDLIDTHINKNIEIEKMVQDMLDASIIRPSKSSFSTSTSMVKRKDNYCSMCHDYIEINKITIENKFPIPNIDELLDEFLGVVYFPR
jgi:hypothetical protein